MAKPRRKTRKRAVASIVAEEERLLVEVQAEIDQARRPGERDDYDAELIALRDALAEEKLPDDQAMLLAQMDRVAALSAVRAQAPRSRIDPTNPYFAHLKLEVDGEEVRDILLGRQTFVQGNVRIVDWRHAPISRVFYRYREGETFAEEIADRQMEGQVLARRTLTVVDGHLMRLSAPQGTFLRTSAGWQDISEQASSLGGGAGSATRPDTAATLLGSPNGSRDLRADKHLPEIVAQLDPEQFELLTRDGASLLVVAGGAGSGKTTVGLHRLAYLIFADAKRFRPRRMLVLVFGKALARYISRVLPALGVDGVPVQTLGDWALTTRRRHFSQLAPHIASNTPAVVVRFKTHRILVPMLEEATSQNPNAEPALLFDELFTDRGWLAAGVERFAPGAFSAAEIALVHRWCTDQQFRRADPTSFSDDEPAGYDEEDSLILLRLYQLLRGRLLYGGRRKLSYDHVMVDEVQDFSPLELLVLMQTVRDGSITLAGDPAQKITDNDFSDWSEVLRLLGQDDAHISPLRVSYRSTKQIMELAHAVLGPLAPDEPARTNRSGAPVDLIRFSGQGQAMTFLADTLLDLVQREPNASVAVLARTSRQADDAYHALGQSDLPGLSRVADQDFSFGPGIEVTDVAQTKGLEFDYVVLLNVDRVSFPLTDSARHLLHVGATRAIHQLWLLVWDQPSPLLPGWLEPHFGG